MTTVTDWRPYAPYFTEAEFRCKHTGKVAMQAAFMARLTRFRRIHDRPMMISSGYRHPTHPVEARKARPGAHAHGRAADTAVSHEDARRFLFAAALHAAVEAGLMTEEQARAWLPEMLKHGFTGIGVQQKGSGRFIHLDDCGPADINPRPHIWSY